MAGVDTASVNELVAMGFTIQQAMAALEKCNNDKEEAVNWIFSGGELISNDFVGKKDEEDLSKVIEMSMHDTSSSAGHSFDPVSPEERVRVPGVPVGLRNVGNTCYFNSLLQAYFMIPNFVKEILSFQDTGPRESEDSEQQRLQSASIQLVHQLQRLFASMIRSHRRYLDPSDVLKSLVDDLGNQLIIGDQKDVGEFNMVLVARIEDGLNAFKEVVEDAPQVAVRKDSSDPSLRKSSLSYSITIPEEGAVSALFYGRQVELLSSAEADGSRIFQHQEAIFGQVMLDVDERDIYSAWDKACFSRIEGYVTPQSYTTAAQQAIWLTRLPKVLLFQIQRVYFDKVSQCSVKKHSPFSIDKVIYPDRFMHDNRQLSSARREQVQALKAKVATLEATLDKYERFANDSLSLDRVLRNAHQFIAEQLSSDPSPFTVAGLSQSCSVLGFYAEHISQSVSDIKAELTSLQAEIKAVFDDLKQHPYHLHSILVHDGMAGSGHYYAYIYDHEGLRWRKYSDIHVTEVTEQEVFERSVGGYSMTSAYCLMYVAATLQADSGQVLRAFAVSEDPQEAPDLYTAMIPQALRVEVDDDNVKLRRELEDYKSNQVIRQLQDLYLARHTTAESQSMSFRSYASTSLECHRFELINLPIFLKTKFEDKISKLQILEQVVREVLQLDLESLDKSGVLYQKISNKLLKSHKDMPLTLTKSAYEVSRQDDLTQEFASNIKDAGYTIFAMRSMVQGDFQAAFGYLKYQRSRTLIELRFFQRVPRDLMRVGVYYLMSGVNTSLYAGNYARACSYAEYLVNWTVEFFDKHGTEYRQVLSSFCMACKFLNENGPAELSAEFLRMFKALEIQQALSTTDIVMPPEFLDLHDKLESMDPRLWIEGWRADGMAARYMNALAEVKSKFQQWYDLSTHITGLRRTLGDAELYDFEMKVASLQSSS
jgi:ubiquitin carboxyl-terminal hydrolase 25/28